MEKDKEAEKEEERGKRVRAIVRLWTYFGCSYSSEGQVVSDVKFRPAVLAIGRERAAREEIFLQHLIRHGRWRCKFYCPRLLHSNTQVTPATKSRTLLITQPGERCCWWHNMERRRQHRTHGPLFVYLRFESRSSRSGKSTSRDIWTLVLSGILLIHHFIIIIHQIECA